MRVCWPKSFYWIGRNLRHNVTVTLKVTVTLGVYYVPKHQTPTLARSAGY